MVRFRRHIRWSLVPLCLAVVYANASTTKPHVIAFGKWTTVQDKTDSAAESGEDKSVTLRIRPLLVDGRAKEFTVGAVHEITERIFVVQRIFRINDTLPQEPALPLRWQWQRGGWILVDRVTGRISAVNLPEFDAANSTVSWYRDYAAYCGMSDDDKKIHAIVTQVGRRKPVVKWQIEEIKPGDEPQWRAMDTDCKSVEWQRAPVHVTFAPNESTKRTYVIHGHAVDLLSDETDDEEASK
jgi:hypothetical protein